MEPVNFFRLASEHNRWLSVRQSAVAQNIANVNTPGYKAVDVADFDATLAAEQLSLSRTQSKHMSPSSGVGSEAGVDDQKSSWEYKVSDNTVTLEEQLLRASEVNGAYARNTSVMKTLHRMFLTSAKG